MAAHLNQATSYVSGVWNGMMKEGGQKKGCGVWGTIGLTALTAAAGLFAFSCFSSSCARKWDISNKVFLITGASSGIGKGLALKLVSLGGKVSLVARREQELNEVVAECNKLKANSAFGVLADVSVRSDNQRMVASTIAHFGRLDVLVLNAGISSGLYFEDVTEEGLTAFEKLTAVNYFGPVYGTHYALPELVKNQGKIVVVSSVLGTHGGPTRTFYSGSKFGLHGFFESLRMELADKHVSIHMICPGPVVTEIERSRIGADGKVANVGHFDPAKAISTEESANYIMQAIQFNKRITFFSFGGGLPYRLGPLFPTFIDALFVRAMKGLGMMEVRGPQ